MVKGLDLIFYTLSSIDEEKTDINKKIDYRYITTMIEKLEKDFYIKERILVVGQTKKSLNYFLEKFNATFIKLSTDELPKKDLNSLALITLFLLQKHCLERENIILEMFANIEEKNYRELKNDLINLISIVRFLDINTFNFTNEVDIY